MAGIKRLSSPGYVIAESAIQLAWGTEVDANSEQLRKLALNRRECEARNVTGLELDQQIEVAVGPMFTAHARAEQR